MSYCKFLIALLFCPLLYAKTVVNVGAYVFQPYYFEVSKSQAEGATVELVSQLNQIQKDYEFVIVKITAPSRYVTFERGRFDIILFESQRWGWNDYSVSSSDILVESCEKYVAKKNDSIDQSVFDNLNSKQLVAVKGYHYGFAKMETQKEKLKEQFSILFVNDNHAALKMLLKERAEVGVIATPYLEYFISTEPEYKNSFLVSEKVDQMYQLSALVREGSQPGVAVLNQYLSELQKNGSISAIVNKWQLSCN